jgi:hypothetical protein
MYGDLEDLEDLIDDLAGDDDDDVGAPRRRKAKAANVKRKAKAVFAQAMPGGMDKTTDVVCPFSEVTFALAAPGPLNAVAEPQKPFIGRRFAVDLARTGASAVGMVRLVALSVGVDPQQAAIGNVSVNNFSSVATATMLKIDGSLPGIKITAQYAVTAALAGADTILVNTTLIGPALQ